MQSAHSNQPRAVLDQHTPNPFVVHTHDARHHSATQLQAADKRLTRQRRHWAAPTNPQRGAADDVCIRHGRAAPAALTGCMLHGRCHLVCCTPHYEIRWPAALSCSARIPSARPVRPTQIIRASDAELNAQTVHRIVRLFACAVHAVHAAPVVAACVATGRVSGSWHCRCHTICSSLQCPTLWIIEASLDSRAALVALRCRSIEKSPSERTYSGTRPVHTLVRLGVACALVHTRRTCIFRAFVLCMCVRVHASR